MQLKIYQLVLEWITNISFGYELELDELSINVGKNILLNGLKIQNWDSVVGMSFKVDDNFNNESIHEILVRSIKLEIELCISHGIEGCINGYGLATIMGNSQQHLFILW